MKEVDVALIAPNTLGSYKFSGKNRESLALGALGAYLAKNGITSELIDARLDHLDQEQVLKELEMLRPLIVGLTLMGDEAAVWSRVLTKTLREEFPGTHIVAGSYFPTLDLQKCFELLPGLDSIVQGEGEETLVELALRVKQERDWSDVRGIAHNRNRKITINPRRGLIGNLDLLPSPTRYARESEISKVSLEGSRGCFARCAFCSIGPHLDPKRSFWRGKTPRKIVEELVELRDQYPNINQYRFVDADFIGLNSSTERMQELADDILAAGFSQDNARLFVETQSRNAFAVPPHIWEQFRKAGLYQIFIGIESGSEKIKRHIKKPSDFEMDLRALDYLRSFGFNVTYGFIMLTPWSNLDDVLENVEVLRSLGNAGLDKYFSELILTPGTRAFEMVSQESGIHIERCQEMERYSFPLPDSLESIRRAGRFMLTNAVYRPFLERIASAYTKIDDLLLKGEVELAGDLRGQVDDINLKIFMEVVRFAQESQGVLSDWQIEKLLLGAIPDFEPEFSLLEAKII